MNSLQVQFLMSFLKIASTCIPGVDLFKGGEIETNV